MRQQFLPCFRRYPDPWKQPSDVVIKGRGSYRPELESAVHLRPAALLSCRTRRTPPPGVCENRSEPPAYTQTQNGNPSQHESTMHAIALMVSVRGPGCQNLLPSTLACKRGQWKTLTLWDETLLVGLNPGSGTFQPMDVDRLSYIFKPQFHHSFIVSIDSSSLLHRVTADLG